MFYDHTYDKWVTNDKESFFNTFIYPGSTQSALLVAGILWQPAFEYLL